GKARELGDFGDRQPFVREQLRGAAGGDQLHAERVQRLRELDDAGLVRNGNQCVHCFRYLSSLCSTSFLRSVLRLRPSHSAAFDWLWSAFAITTSCSGFSTTFTSISYMPSGSVPRRSLK